MFISLIYYSLLITAVLRVIVSLPKRGRVGLVESLKYLKTNILRISPVKTKRVLAKEETLSAEKRAILIAIFQKGLIDRAQSTISIYFFILLGPPP